MLNEKEKNNSQIKEIQTYWARESFSIFLRSTCLHVRQSLKRNYLLISIDNYCKILTVIYIPCTFKNSLNW